MTFKLEFCVKKFIQNTLKARKFKCSTTKIKQSIPKNRLVMKKSKNMNNNLKH